MRAAGNFLAWFVVIVAAACALAWTGIVLFLPDNSGRLNAVANRIMSGDAFTSLMPPIADLDAAEQRTLCNALEIRSAAIIRLRLYEEAVDRADVTAANERMKALQVSIERALACVPTDAFLWFIRYWARVNQGEAASAQLDNLAMSYRLGPNEGWIALRRNVYALAVYDLLPDQLRAEVRREFASLVHAGFLRQALRNLQGSGWPLREILLPELADTSLAMRQLFYRMLRTEGLDLAIPGVERREILNWR
jgi:hypothetical protein